MLILSSIARDASHGFYPLVNHAITPVQHAGWRLAASGTRGALGKQTSAAPLKEHQQATTQPKMHEPQRMKSPEVATNMLSITVEHAVSFPASRRVERFNGRREKKKRRKLSDDFSNNSLLSLRHKLLYLHIYMPPPGPAIRVPLAVRDSQIVPQP